MEILERIYNENGYGDHEKHFIHHATVSMKKFEFIIVKQYIKTSFISFLLILI